MIYNGEYAIELGGQKLFIEKQDSKVKSFKYIDLWYSRHTRQYEIEVSIK